MKIDGGSASAAAPRPSPQLLHQLRDEVPLRAARVLELVDEHVAVARLELVAALRELVHVLEELNGPLEDAREIEQRARVERVRWYCASATA